MNCSDLIMQFLYKNDVNRIFGIPGYANSPLIYATKDHPTIKTVLTRHEANAAWMAYGYALVSGRFGVCTGTSGAGTTNIVSAVSAAFYNSVPILVLTGQVEKNKFGKGAFQELTGVGARSISAIQLLDKITKMSILVERSDQLPQALDAALVAMMSGRPGPVHINLPVDLQKEVIKNPLPDLFTPCLPARPEATKEELNHAIDLLLSAKNPLMLIGRGCLHAKEQLQQLINQLGIPHCTTMQGRGLLNEEHPYFLGTLGIAGSPRCNAYLDSSCDLVLGIGTSLGEFTTNGYTSALGRTARLVHVDIDAAEFGKSVPPLLSIRADAKAFCRDFITQLDKQTLAPERRDEWISYSGQTRYVEVPRNKDIPGLISPMEAIDIIHQQAPDDTIFLADSGNNAVWAAHYLPLGIEQSFIIDVNTGCMGSGVVSAIGAKCAAPARPVISICGDGGFMMNGVDVATAVEENLAIVWIVFNDSKLGMVEQGFDNKYGSSLACRFNNADICAMAKAYGADSLVVHTPAELENALRDIADLKKPLVIDLRFNDQYLPSVYARVRPTTDDLAFVKSASGTPTGNLMAENIA